MWGLVRKTACLTFALALCAGWAIADGAGKLVVSAERDLYGFHGQQAMVYGADSVTFVRNSNFLCKPTAEVLLGEFHAALTDARKAERDYLSEIAARLPKTGGGSKGSENAAPHATHFFLGEEDVSARKDDSQSVGRVLADACETSWVADHAVSVKAGKIKGVNTLTITALTAAGPGKTRALSFKEAHCQQKGKSYWECPVTNFGLAGLEVKP